MPGLPVILNLRGQKCLIVGGGPVALRRAHALLAAGCNLITIVAPHIDPALRELPVTIHERPVRETDLVDKRLVVLATDDAHLHDRIGRQAQALGVLVNRADNAARSEIIFMSRTQAGPVTIAVHSGGTLPDAAREIARELRSRISEHWPLIIEIAAPFRQLIRQNFAEITHRRARIARLTDTAAVTLFQSQGADAYRKHCEAMCQPETIIPSQADHEEPRQAEPQPGDDIYDSDDESELDNFSFDAVSPA